MTSVQPLPEHEAVGAQIQAMRETVELMRQAHRRHGAPSLEGRRELLEDLLQLVRRRRDAIAEAVMCDYGHRSRHETLLAEIYPLVRAIHHAKKHLKRWMRPRPLPRSLLFAPARNRLTHQPLGVVGIVAPWSFPVHLTLLPLVDALAAGNRVVIKPSEYAPHTAELLRAMLEEAFTSDQVRVFTGGPAIGEAFAALPFDHLLFTGSPRVARRVLELAARNLTPVTLELGGKCPVLVHPDYPIARAAARIGFGKLFNAGQSCVAPDYALVHESRRDELVAELQAVVAAMYPRLAANPDYTSIINETHFRRLEGLIADARDKGATIVELNPAGEPFDLALRKLPPTLILNPNDDMAVMQEEIFGPILPVRVYRSLDEGIDSINERPPPLAFYYFDTDDARVEDVISSTVSGNVAVNDTMLQVVQPELPFGGVGRCGTGRYHGRAGFRTFSNPRSVFHQGPLSALAMLRPPYHRLLDRVVQRLVG